MNIQEFMKNPTGKGTVIPGREAILETLNRRYHTLTKTKPIDVTIYANKDIVYYHFKITTEADERDNDYDIVIKFIPTAQHHIADGFIRNYNIQIFSNCPSFTYTYAYVANLNGMLVDELKGKFSGTVLKNPPVSRNPGLILGYEKSVYFACKHLLENTRLMSKSDIEYSSEKFNAKAFVSKIRTADKIEEEIRRSKNKKKADETESKNKKAKEIMANRSKVQNFGKRETKTTNQISKKAAIGSTIKKVKPIKKVKAIKKKK